MIVVYRALYLCYISAMRFAFPRFPAEFEIPDPWWVEAGMPGFNRRGSAYRSSATDVLVLDDIEPPFRTKRLDANGFVHDRLVSILSGSTQCTRESTSGVPKRLALGGGTSTVILSEASGRSLFSNALNSDSVIPVPARPL